MDVLLIRHAESANNALWARDPDAFTSSRTHDPPLTDLGFEQADLLARHLAERGARIDRLVASPMLRAIQTARPLAAALGLELEVWVEVHERGGIYVGDPATGEGFVAHPGLSRSAIDELVPGARLPDAIDDDGLVARRTRDRRRLRGPRRRRVRPPGRRVRAGRARTT